jgi:hypothetical protein
MDAAGIELADLDGLSVAKLKLLLCEKHVALQEQHAQLLSHREQIVVKDEQIRFYTVEIEALKLQILKLRRMQFGNSSEKRALDIEQLELLVENLETGRCGALVRAGPTDRRKARSEGSQAAARVYRASPARNADDRAASIMLPGLFVPRTREVVMSYKR